MAKTKRLISENLKNVDIIIEIPRKTGLGTVSFTSGWMVEANGKLTLNTPYGGK